MKLKIFSLIAVAMLVISCSSEESAEIQPQQIADVENSQEPTGPSYGPTSCLCDSQYVFPTSTGAINQMLITVEFDSSMGLDEIHCWKYDLFECEGNGGFVVWVAAIQPDLDPYTEDWYVLTGYPGGDVINDICNDPLVQSEACDD